MSKIIRHLSDGTFAVTETRDRELMLAPFESCATTYEESVGRRHPMLYVARHLDVRCPDGPMPPDATHIAAGPPLLPGPKRRKWHRTVEKPEERHILMKPIADQYDSDFPSALRTEIVMEMDAALN